MKSTKLSLVAISILGMFSTISAESLNDAFVNGTLTGDVSTTYETRNFDKENFTYYSNNAYAVASAELMYKTAKFYNFSITYAMRGYKSLYEDDSSFETGTGKGDASSRFYDLDGGDTAMVSNAYLAYDNELINAKFGRQKIHTDWVNKTHDAVNIIVHPLDSLSVQAIWTNTADMRSTSRDLRNNGDDINGDDGIYKLDLTYKIIDPLKVTAYVLDAPTSHSVYGGKVMLDAKGDYINYGGLVHYVQTDEETTDDIAGTTNLDKDDGSMIYVNAYIEYKGFNVTAGYIKTGEDVGWGSANAAGETVDPFEEGDAMFRPDARVLYVSLSKTIADLSLSAIYGTTDYRDYRDTERLNEKEFCLYAGYDITKQLNLSGIYTYVDADEDSISGYTPNSDFNQFTATVTYKF